MTEKRGRGRPKTDKEWIMVNVRFEPSTVEALDAHLEMLMKDKGVNISRMELIRQIVREYLATKT